MLQDLTDEDEILKRAFQFFDKDGNGEISVQARGARRGGFMAVLHIGDSMPHLSLVSVRPQDRTQGRM
jgi:hypothetical protein